MILKLNQGKTEAVWLGQNIGNKTKPLSLRWNNTFFKCLGIWFNTDTNLMIEKNYKEKLHSLKKLLNIWRQRQLSLKGKITVIWSVALPQLLYACSTLYTPNWVINEADELFFKFLWSDKKAHVKKTSIIADTKNGGLKMLHFESMVKAVKINWIKRYRNVDSNYCKIVSYFTGINLPISTIISCQLDNTLIACKDPFYQQMFEY